MARSKPGRFEASGEFQLPWLIKNAQNTSDPSNVGALLDLYRNYLRLIAQTQINSKLRIRVDPSDVVQETFLDAHRDFASFRGQTEAELIAWLRRILSRNICDQANRHAAKQRDFHREQSLQEAMDRSSMLLGNALKDDVASPSQQAEKREQAVLVADAIAALPDLYRQVIVMRQLHRIPFTDIGEQLGKSSGAVRMIWLRAIESLRESFKPT